VVEPEVTCETLIKRLHGWIGRRARSAELTQLGDDLPCDTRPFEALGRDLLDNGGQEAALLAAFGIARPGSERLDDTAFRTMSGAGHQRFLKFARQIAEQTTADHLERCLFARWMYEDRGPTLRFDPADDRRYALRADDPAKSRGAPIRSVRGANALAFEGLALLPVIPTECGTATTLVRRENGSIIVRWALWETPLSCDTAACLLCRIPERAERGISAIFQARRLTTGKYRAFSPAERVR
jgi:hypothetical protein